MKKFFIPVIVFVVLFTFCGVNVFANEDYNQDVLKKSNTLINISEQIINRYTFFPKGIVNQSFRPAYHYIEKLKKEMTEKENLSTLKYFDENGRVLRKGMAGEDIYQVNYLLSKTNNSITPNFYFDLSTENYIKNIQKNNNIEANGIIGVNTYKILNSIIKEKNILLPLIELSFDSEIPNKNWIIINKTNNTLYYLNKEEVIKKYPIATGSNPTYTPEGKFYISCKAVNPGWGGGGYAKPIKGGDPKNPLGKRWMGISYKGGWTYGIHGNIDKNSIGTFASHGCIRMHNKDVIDFYEVVKINTPVWMGSENKLKDFGIKFVIKIGGWEWC